MRVGPQRGESADEWFDAVPHASLRHGVIAYTGFVGRAPVPVRHREVPSGELILVLSDGGSGPSRAPATQSYSRFPRS